MALVFILVLILATSLVKNSTKEIEDSIFNTKENIRSLNIKFGDVMLDYNYLSSPEILIQHQSQFFENDLVKIDIINIKKITKDTDQLEITDLIDKPQVNE